VLDDAEQRYVRARTSAQHFLIMQVSLYYVFTLDLYLTLTPGIFFQLKPT
jgi:hypothetical protein